MKFKMQIIDIPDISNLDNFLKAKTCPICIAIRKDNDGKISYKHDTRFCINKHLILHYLSNSVGVIDDKELRKYTVKCMREIDKYRKNKGLIEI